MICDSPLFDRDLPSRRASAVVRGVVLAASVALLAVPSRAGDSIEVHEVRETIEAAAQVGSFAVAGYTFAASGRGTFTTTGTTLAGSIGQPAASTASSIQFRPLAGLWPAMQPRPAEIFADGFESGDTSAWGVVVP